MRTVESWCRGIPRWTAGEAKRAHQVARLLRDHSDVLTAEAAVLLPVGHLHEIARAAANPRCADKLGEVVPAFLYWGEKLDHAAFRKVVKHFEALADQDGSHHDHDESHQTRRFSLIPTDTGGTLSGHLGSLQTAIFNEIHERFCHAEFLADWQWVRDTYGDDATADKLPRTATQRRADALVAMALRAASMPPDAVPPEPIVFVIDYQTFVQTARRRARAASGAEPTDAATENDAPTPESEPLDEDHSDGDRTLGDEEGDDSDDGGQDDVSDDDRSGSPSTSGSRPSPATDPARRRCESGGVPLPPDDVSTAAVLGRIRRVVVDSAGVIIDVGRSSRLFRGPVRDALLVLGGRCTCLGCSVRHRLEVDHITTWKDLGNTDADNGDPRCRWHNLLKNKGFTTFRDADGIWHFYRPDGSEITPI